MALAYTPTELDLVFGTEPIVAWRGWRYTKHVNYDVATIFSYLSRFEVSSWPKQVEILDCPMLGAIGVGTPWWPKIRGVAKCDQGIHEEEHSCPGPQCACGFWAFKNEDTISGIYHRYGSNRPHIPIAFGQVFLWGKIIETEHGYRAQYAYPKEVSLYHSSEEEATDLAELYSIPVKSEEVPENWAYVGKRGAILPSNPFFSIPKNQGRKAPKKPMSPTIPEMMKLMQEVKDFKWT